MSLVFSGNTLAMMNGARADSIGDDSEGADPFYPVDTVPFENQVAGHSNANGKSTIGLLKHKEGYVMKPMLKPAHAEREKMFYTELQQAVDLESVQLKNFVPEYLGTNILPVDNKAVEFLILKNVTSGFAEPCVMDVKIGRQTWDPQASAEKRQHEDNKYADSKRDLGFCIPGFQVHDIASGKLVRMEKDYGNKLTKDTTKDALKLFLNSESGLSRRLLLQLLAHLWRILRWSRGQHKYRLYSSSLLLVYDARRLRQYLKTERSSSPVCPSTPEPLSPSSSPSPSSPIAAVQRQSRLVRSDSWHASLERLARTHSFNHDYEKNLQNAKENYSFLLEDLTGRPTNKEAWATVKMIDFAHAFVEAGEDVDLNYLTGIESLVKMVEELLDEATC